jgi:hypothetical protein
MKLLTRKYVALAAAFIAIAPTVSGCSSFLDSFQDGVNSTQTFTFDVKALEEDLAYNIQVDTDVVQFVTCPESMSGTLGAEWTCWTEDEWGFGSDVFVTLTGLDGTYLYDVASFSQDTQDGDNEAQAFVYDVPALEAALESNIQLDTNVVQFVTCPETMSGTVGTEWTCWTEDEWGFGSDVFVKLTDLEGNFVYDVVNF